MNKPETSNNALIGNIRKIITNEQEKHNIDFDTLLKEENQMSNDVILLSDDNKFVGSKLALNAQEEAFKNNVDQGATFGIPGSTNPSDAPGVVLVHDKILILHGTIPFLNNLRWELIFNNGNSQESGCYIYADKTTLNADSIMILSKLQKYYDDIWLNEVKNAKELQAIFNGAPANGDHQLAQGEEETPTNTEENNQEIQ